MGSQDSSPGERRFISFFSGALGLDTGLGAAGLEPLAVNEVDRAACETIRVNRPNLKLYHCDIRELTFNRLSQDLGIRSGELFAVVGGPPCQAFSTAGRRLGLNDERGNVFLHFIDLIGELQPKYAIFENVRGLLSAPLTHRPHSDRGPGKPPLSDEELPGGALLHVLSRLKQAGYTTNFTLYNTANYGVPQIRERLIFFASREGKVIPFISPTHDEFGRNGLPFWRTLRQTIGHLQSLDQESMKFPEARLKYYRMLRDGQNWRNLPAEVQKEAMGLSWFAGGGKTGFFRRLAWERPAPTLVTRPNMKATDLCHPEALRPLSVQEYAAIQTFPEDFVFAGKLDERYRQIGNAVPCVFGRAIGEHLISFDQGNVPENSVQSKMSRYVGTDHASWYAAVAKTQQPIFAW